MKIRIEKAQCVGNARCSSVSDHIYRLDEDGYIENDDFDVPTSDEKAAKNGARACPERIIFVMEDDGSQIWPPQ